MRNHKFLNLRLHFYEFLTQNNFANFYDYDEISQNFNFRRKFRKKEIFFYPEAFNQRYLHYLRYSRSKIGILVNNVNYSDI